MAFVERREYVICSLKDQSEARGKSGIMESGFSSSGKFGGAIETDADTRLHEVSSDFVILASLIA